MGGAGPAWGRLDRGVSDPRPGTDPPPPGPAKAGPRLAEANRRRPGRAPGVCDPLTIRLRACVEIRRVLADIVVTVKAMFATRPEVMWFLLAQMISTDGLTPLFAFGGIYAAGPFGMTMAEVIGFGVAINVTAAVGAVLFAWIDGWLGPRRAIATALSATICLRAARLTVSTKAVFS